MPLTNYGDHTNFGYRGKGVYACSCGHPLTEEGPNILKADAAEAIADLKVAWLAHRLEVEEEVLGK